jgi:hypothetical protein
VTELSIGLITLRRLRFPGRAGDLQAQGSTASVIRELGDNYETYHEYLRAELAKFPRRPVPEDFVTRQAYYDAWTRVQEIVAAEALLRNCRAFRRDGRPLDAALDPKVPLIDDKDRLVDFAAAG